MKYNWGKRWDKQYEPRWLVYTALEALILTVVICGDLCCGLLFLFEGRYGIVQFFGALLTACGLIILEQTLRLVLTGRWH